MSRRTCTIMHTIMSSAKTEEDYNKDDVCVTSQVPTEMRHATAKLYHLAKVIKDNHPNANVIVKDQNIYINKQKRRPPVIPPTLKQILTTDPNEIDIMNNVFFFT